jgi:hypothetical protein
MNARPQEFLRSFDPADRSAQLFPEFTDILWCSIGQVFFGLRPNEFVGIELRGIGMCQWK